MNWDGWLSRWLRSAPTNWPAKEANNNENNQSEQLAAASAVPYQRRPHGSRLSSSHLHLHLLAELEWCNYGPKRRPVCPLDCRYLKAIGSQRLSFCPLPSSALPSPPLLSTQLAAPLLAWHCRRHHHHRSLLSCFAHLNYTLWSHENMMRLINRLVQHFNFACPSQLNGRPNQTSQSASADQPASPPAR